MKLGWGWAMTPPPCGARLWLGCALFAPTPPQAVLGLGHAPFSPPPLLQGWTTPSPSPLQGQVRAIMPPASLYTAGRGPAVTAPCQIGTISWIWLEDDLGTAHLFHWPKRLSTTGQEGLAHLAGSDQTHTKIIVNNKWKKVLNFSKG